MSFTSLSVDKEGNQLRDEDHVIRSRDKRDCFHKQIAKSFDEMNLACQDEEKSIYEYMRHEQHSPDTLDEICRQTHVEMEYVIQWMETMVSDGLVERQVTCGVSRYVLTEDGKTGNYSTNNTVSHVNNDLSEVESRASSNDFNGNENPECLEDTYTEDSNASTEELEQHLEEGCWVLVNGCDSGEFISGLATKFPHTSFIALHNDRECLVNIMEICVQAEVYNVNFQEGDPDLLPNSWIQCFDWVILYDVIHDVPDVKQTLQNARRVLKKTGVLSLTFKPERTSMKDADFENGNTAREVHPEDTTECVNGSTKTDSTKGTIFRKGQDSFLTADFVREKITETMFEMIRSDAMNSNEERMHIMCSVTDGN